jgi:hypothetical protein
VFYDHGYCVAQDYEEAVKWYRKATEQGFAWAQRNLGGMYWNGDGVVHDDAEAVKWYRKAANQGAADAQYNLALIGLGDDFVIIPPEQRQEASEGNRVPKGFSLYRRADLKKAFANTIDPASFYEISYKKTLEEMVQYILNIEGPILLDDLVTRIARAHDFRRSGDRIRKRVETAFKWKQHLDRAPDSSKFVWPAETFESRSIQPRLPATDEDIRLPNQIPMEELIALAEKCSTDDKIYEMAQLLGIKRVGPDVRVRLTKAIS